MPATWRGHRGRQSATEPDPSDWPKPSTDGTKIVERRRHGRRPGICRQPSAPWHRRRATVHWRRPRWRRSPFASFPRRERAAAAWAGSSAIGCNAASCWSSWSLAATRSLTAVAGAPASRASSVSARSASASWPKPSTGIASVPVEVRDFERPPVSVRPLPSMNDPPATAARSATAPPPASITLRLSLNQGSGVVPLGLGWPASFPRLAWPRRLLRRAPQSVLGPPSAVGDIALPQTARPLLRGLGFGSFFLLLRGTGFLAGPLELHVARIGRNLGLERLLRFIVPVPAALPE